MRITRAKLSYANVVASLALFIALGGSAYAAVKVTGKDIKDGTITSKDVKDRGLTVDDFAGSVQGPQGAPGPQGVKGETGPPGPTGPQGGSSMASGTLTEVQGTMTAGSSSSRITLASTAQCAAGQRLVTGGFTVGFTGDTFVQASRRSDDGNGWTVLGTGTAPRVQAIAYCQ